MFYTIVTIAIHYYFFQAIQSSINVINCKETWQSDINAYRTKVMLRFTKHKIISLLSFETHRYFPPRLYLKKKRLFRARASSPCYSYKQNQILILILISQRKATLFCTMSKSGTLCLLIIDSKYLLNSSSILTRDKWDYKNIFISKFMITMHLLNYLSIYY